MLRDWDYECSTSALHYFRGVDVKHPQGNAAKAEPERDKFTQALASVLSVSPSEIQDKLAQAKTEKPLPHKRYKYVPEEDRP